MSAESDSVAEVGWLADRYEGRGPIYLQLTERIRAAIQNGELKADAPLPSEREISETLGVSRSTVRKAIDVLAAEGLLEQRHGSGTFVMRRVEQKLRTLRSFSEEMRARGFEPSSIVFEKAVVYPSPEEILALSISPSARVLRFGRIRLADEMPMAVERVTIDHRFVGDVEQIQDSLYDTLRRRGYAPVRALQRMHAAEIPATDAKLMNLREGAPVLLMERRSYLPDGTVVEFTRSTYRGDTYDFVVELTMTEEFAE